MSILTKKLKHEKTCYIWLKWPFWSSENNFEMMLQNECSCTLSKMFSWRQSISLSNSYSNGGMETWEVGGKRSQAHLKWAWNGSGPKLLAPIAPNKNEQPS
jgi:hypothetical protein